MAEKKKINSKQKVHGSKDSLPDYFEIMAIQMPEEQLSIAATQEMHQMWLAFLASISRQNIRKKCICMIG